MQRVESYLRRTFGNATIRIVPRPRKTDSAEVYIGEEAIGMVGDDCTVGHSAILHGCTIGNGSLIGMGATVLNGARIGAGSLVGANALVTEGKVFPEHSLIVGSPARAIRTLEPGDVEKLLQSA